MSKILKDARLEIRLTKEEKDKLKNLSQNRGLKVSEFILQELIYKNS